MNILIIINYAFYGVDTITEEGGKQLKNIAAVIRSKFLGGDLTLLTSPAKRARASAEILSKILYIPIHYVSDAFLQDTKHEQDNENFLNEVKKRAPHTNCAIVVTHHAYMRDIPKILTRDFIEPTINHNRSGGACMIINLQEKKFEEIILDLSNPIYR